MPQKILIIEDEEVLTELIRKKLEKEGYIVETAEDGEAGLKKIQSTNPDLVLLDMRLAGSMEGIEVLRRLRQRQPLPRR